MLEALAAGNGTGTVPYSDAAAQDALYNSYVKCERSESRDSSLSQFVDKVETLLTCFGGQFESQVEPQCSAKMIG